MNRGLLVAALLVPAGCEMMPGGGPEAELPRQAEFVALVERSGCRVDPVDHAFVHEAGFSDADLASFGRALVAADEAEVGSDGSLVLVSGTCF